ncbi:hypothetical protein B0T22DRAFT_452314 [Podospora appendiculata]|uniref:gamma-glutamylcyclotransferase n=1 Tax=Podospora appendiculata TaxID=314037 RepID=A0AAE0XK27_9PEZI|nr:hypothetical protein B0T22DRAFT_452314 [Podospora appendiculata]
MAKSIGSMDSFRASPSPAQQPPPATASNMFLDTADTTLRLPRPLQSLNPIPAKPAPSYPPISSLPRTSPARLSALDATPSLFSSGPVAPPSPVAAAAPSKPASVLYLAYGSNLSAETFLGKRGIRPVSKVNVSAPSLRLTFDLPGLPYLEPCFANTAIRKLPGRPPPPKFPPGVPDIPHNPPPTTRDGSSQADSTTTTSSSSSSSSSSALPSRGGAVWNNGLIGVVYEVTPADYAKIIATEGGGMSYQDILVPCLTLPANVGVPERPPEIPLPFLAHTLFAPRLPDAPDDGGDTTTTTTATDDNDDDQHPSLPRWAKRLLLPVRRSDPDYAEPSARYLQLIRDGAREHDLPADYQAYLGALEPYTITTRRQRFGRILFLGFWAPVFVFLMLGSLLLADGKGKVPKWFAAVMVVMNNFVWLSYDFFAKGIFGDGERTVPDDDEVADERRTRMRTRRRSSVLGLAWRKAGERPDDEEKRCLLASGF